MKIESRPLSGTRLVQAWLAGDPGASRFFPASPSDLDGYAAKAREVDSRIGKDTRRRVAGHLLGGGAERARRLEEFVSAGGYLVTTGQQPGLFGGPLYGLYKGLTVSWLARTLEEHLQRPVLPVFWIASEDHDWEEVRRTHVLSPSNELEEIALPPRNSGPARSLHRISLDHELEAVLDAFLELHPSTDFSGRWEEVLRASYPAEATLASGFQHVMEELLGPAGVFLVQAHDPDLKARSLPMLLKELEESAVREDELKATASELERAGFELQVPLFDEATNVFMDSPNGRERIFRDGDGFRLRGSGERLTLSEIESRGREDPLVLSPNVLLRPVVESALLPTLAYVAGPGEVAYLPQTIPVFRGHEVDRPIVHPRVSLYIQERKVGKVMEKFDLDMATLARPYHEIAGELVRDDIPEDVSGSIASLRGALREGGAELLSAAKELDSTLSGPIEGFRRQGLGLLDDVERKIVQALKRENEVTLSQVRKAQLHLFPLGRPQERVLNPFYYLFRYGDAFLDEVEARARDAVLPR